MEKLRESKLKLTHRFLFLFSLLPITGMTIFTGDGYVIIYTFISLFFFLKEKHKFDHFIFVILMLNLLIHVISYMLLGPFNISTFIGYNLRLLAPYFGVKILFNQFAYLYATFAYRLAIVSIPFYIIQLINVNLLKLLSPLFINQNNEIRAESDILGFFIHTVHFKEPYRNAGFTWEPGGFAFFLGIGLLFGLGLSNFKLDKKNWLILIVGMTTLSTTFYIFLAFVFILINNNIKIPSYVKKLVLLPLLLFGVYSITNLPFMSEKILKAIDDYNEISRIRLEGSDFENGIGRIGAFQQNIIDFAKYPLGYGINENGRTKTYTGVVIGGPVGLSRIIVQWGLIGIAFLVYIFRELPKTFTRNNLTKSKWIFSLSTLLFLFSNPIERQPIFLMIMFMPFIKSNQILAKRV